jgi:transposase
VARVLGAGRTTVYGWLALYRQGGWGALDARKRGGRKPKLDAAGMAWVYRTVTLGDPRQYKFRFALWTSVMMGQLIREHLGIDLSKASVCRLLNQLGLSAQRPLWRAYQQDPAKVARWLETEFPRIQAEARIRRASIWFGDEAGVRSDGHAGTTWAPRGKTPVVSTTGARFGLNLISAVNRRGDLRFMGVKGRVNAEVFIGFLRRLLHGATRPVFLIVDGHPSHKAAKVRKFEESTGGRLKLFFLPPYSPELNPDEHVWNDLKNNGLGRIALTGPDHLHKEVLSHMRFLQKSPHLIRSFFKAPTTSYAA